MTFLMQECSIAQLQLLAAAPTGPSPMGCTSEPAVELSNVALSRLGKGGVALVLGSEGQGLSPEVQRGCAAISLSMSNGVQSLNVASAGAIFMHLLSGQLNSTVLQAAALLSVNEQTQSL
jgi:RNA methyltransferase, TrmH family